MTRRPVQRVADDDAPAVRVAVPVEPYTPEGTNPDPDSEGSEPAPWDAPTDLDPTPPTPAGPALRVVPTIGPPGRPPIPGAPPRPAPVVRAVPRAPTPPDAARREAEATPATVAMSPTARALEPAPGEPRPLVRSSPSVMVSSATLPSARESLVVPPIAGSERSYLKPTYRTPAQLPGRGPAHRAVDAPVAQDLFRDGGYDDLEAAALPFDDHPAQVMEDVGQPYTTVYTVGDPPPLPGIADRFTPPAALPTEIGSRRVRHDTSGSPGPDRKERFEPTPAPSRRQVTPKLTATNPAPPPPSEPKANPQWMWFGFAGVGVGLIGLLSLGGAIALVYGGSGGDDPDLPGRSPRAATERPVEAPKPAPTVAAPAPAVPVTTGTLKVRANRRALVYVDEQAVGYTPTSVQLPPGTHALSAMMPGQPNSRQSRQAVIPNAGDTVSVEFTF